ncbi:MAG: GNAT family N-acetyltransferase [Desulfotomaculales bacterium]
MAAHSGIGKEVEIIARASPGLLAELSLDSGLNNFCPAAGGLAGVLERIAGLPRGIVNIAVSKKTIVGYVTFFASFSEYHPAVLEMGGIETAAPWRRRGIATELLRCSFRNREMERNIVYVRGYHYHWDLEGCGLDVLQYREMLLRLYSGFGFQLWFPPGWQDVHLFHPVDFVMLRVGKEVPGEEVALLAEIFC